MIALRTNSISLYTLFFFGICLLSAPLAAETNPCDLNDDGVVNSSDVQVARQMMRGLLNCTADIIGVDECNQQVVKRVQTASQNRVCVTGTPQSLSLSSLALSLSVINDGQTGVGTVALSGPVHQGGAQILLSSSSAAVQLPISVEVPEGASLAQFVFTGGGVTTPTSVILTANYSGVWATANLVVEQSAPVILSGLTVAPASLATGQSAVGTVALTGTAPSGGVTVSISSSSGLVSVPSNVTVPQGSSTATFTVKTGTVSTTAQVQLTASYSGSKVSFSLTLNPATVALSWVASVSPDVAGYNVFRGTSSGGPYTQINSSLVAGTGFVDSSVQAAVTYYYVTTSVNTSNDQSAYSNQASATVP